MEREAVPRVGVEEGREACVHVNVNHSHSVCQLSVSQMFRENI